MAECKLATIPAVREKEAARDMSGELKPSLPRPFISKYDGRAGLVQNTSERLLASAFTKRIQRPYQKYFVFAEDQPFTLESGQTLGPVVLAYETYGTLNAARDNAVLICHALTGDSHCASHAVEGLPDEEEGWWEPLIGPGRPFDPTRHFILCINVLGGCQGSTGPASFDADGRPYGMRFPVVTIRDMVRAQERLIRHLGIERLALVVGGSMGGMQTLEWAVTFPDMVGAAVAMATPGRAWPQAIAYNEVGRRAIMNDPNWNGGDYYGRATPDHGLAVARMLGMITYQSDVSMMRKFGRELVDVGPQQVFDVAQRFQIESYLHYQGRKLVNRFDANSYLYLTRACDFFDLGHGYPSYEAALARIQCPLLVVGISSDILYPTYQQKEIVEAIERGRATQNGAVSQLLPPATYLEIETALGHDGFLLEFEQLEPALHRFMDAYGI